MGEGGVVSKDIIIADDEAAWRTAFRRLLEAGGYRVVATAVNGVEAVALSRRHPFALLITDMQMPQVDGLGVVRALVGAHGEPRVMILSSSGDRDVATAALAAGARGYLLKSTDPDRLLAAVDLVVRGGLAVDDGLPRPLGRYLDAFASALPLLEEPAPPESAEDRRRRSGRVLPQSEGDAP
jgi:DNA-binding NarL/FixJ family response regulator